MSNKPVKLMNAFYDHEAVYKAHELDTKAKDLTYKWEPVLIEEKSENGANRTFSKGQRKFMEVVGTQVKL
jgi:hypothetical protein